MMQRRPNKYTALVDLEAFPASVEQSLNPALKGRPVIVGGLPPARGIVICASYEARAKGVKFGMSLAEAFRVLPEAVFLKGDVKVYRDWWAQVCDIFQRFTPELEPVSMDEAYLGLPVYPPHTIEEVSRSLREAVDRRLGISCRIGVGRSKLFAKIACELARDKRVRGEEPLVVIETEKQEGILADLPVSRLPNLGFRTAVHMQELGVTTAAQLRRIPPSVLRAAFGRRGLEWHDHARGIDRRKIKGHLLPRTISRETTFNADSNDRSFLAGVSYYLLERVCLELRRRRLMTRRLGLKLRQVDFTAAETAVTLSRPTDSEAEMSPYLGRLFDDLYPGRQGIRHIGVVVSSLLPAAYQSDLFGYGKRARDLSLSLDRLRSRHGYHAVYYGRTLRLKEKFREVVDGYELRTPSLSL